MKNKYRLSALLILLLSGCGQPGPLYLPKDKPPVYVAPEPKVSASSEENVLQRTDKKVTGTTTQQ